MWLAAPFETRDAAAVAILVGIAGLSYSLLQYYRLVRASRELSKIEISPDQPDANWELAEKAIALPSFVRMMDRLNRSRRVLSGEPEATWRAAFELVANAEEENEAIVRSMASVAVLVGLGGTVLGFARLTGPLLLIQQGSVSASLTSELSGAFLATLAGIFSAILILIGAVPLLRRAEEIWLGAVEDIGRIILIPLLPRPPTKIQDAALEELKRRLDSVKQAWVEALGEPARLLSGIASSAQGSVEQLTRALAGINSEALGDLSTSARSVKNSTNSMAKSVARFEKSAAELGEISGEFERALGELQRSMIANTQRVEGMERSLASAEAEVRKQGEGISLAMASMKDKFVDLAEVVRHRTAQETTIFESARRTADSIDQQLQQLSRAAQELYVSARNITLSSSAVRDAVTPLPKDLAAALRTWLEVFQRKETLLMEQIRERLESFAEISRSLMQASERIARNGYSRKSEDDKIDNAQQSASRPSGTTREELPAGGSIRGASIPGAGSSDDVLLHEEQRRGKIDDFRFAGVEWPEPRHKILTDQPTTSTGNEEQLETIPETELPFHSDSVPHELDSSGKELARDSIVENRTELSTPNNRIDLPDVLSTSGETNESSPGAGTGGAPGKLQETVSVGENQRRGLLAWFRRLRS